MAFTGTGTLVAVLVRGDAASQAEDLFAALEAGLEQGVVREVTACIDEDYPYFTLWPRLAEHPEVGGTVPPEPAARQEAGRRAAEAGLRHVFATQMFNRDVARDFTYVIHAVTEVGDDRFEADVSFELAVTGSRIGGVPRQEHVTFVLRRTGWLFPAMRILNHPPFHPGGL